MVPKEMYRLVFFDKESKEIEILPLGKETKENFVMPNNTTYVTLTSTHLEEINKKRKKYVSSDIYFLSVRNKVVYNYDNHYGSHYLKIIESNRYRNYISSNHRTFKTEEELIRFIELFIKYFKNVDFSVINNDITYNENEKGKDFEKKLIREIKIAK